MVILITVRFKKFNYLQPKNILQRRNEIMRNVSNTLQIQANIFLRSINQSLKTKVIFADHLKLLDRRQVQNIN